MKIGLDKKLSIIFIPNKKRKDNNMEKKPLYELSALIKSIQQNDKNQEVLRNEIIKLENEKKDLLEFIKLHEEYLKQQE